MNEMTAAISPRAAEPPAPRIVHESETQRQHVRISIPIRAEIDGETYVVENWSVAGIGIRDLEPARKTGDLLEARVVFPLQGFDFDVPLTCEVRHVTGDITGCRFIDVGQDQTATLHYLVGAYLSGELVQSGDMLAIKQRSNFGAPRAAPKAAAAESGGVRRWMMAGLLLALGLALVFYVGASIYQRLYISTFEGIVGSPAGMAIRAQTAGIVEGLTVNAGDTVSEGAPIAEVVDAEGKRLPALAPCDCTVIGKLAQAGDVVDRNDALIVVAPPGAATTVQVKAPSRLSNGVSIGDRARLTLIGRDQTVTGTVQSLQRFTPAARNGGSAASGESYVIIDIAPDVSMTLQDYGEPVRVTIDRLQIFAPSAPAPGAAP